MLMNMIDRKEIETVEYVNTITGKLMKWMRKSHDNDETVTENQIRSKYRMKVNRNLAG